MIVDAWLIIGGILGLASTMVCFVAAVLKKKPNDITLLGLIAVELFIVAYTIGSIVRLANGETMAGEAWEFWGYMFTAAMLPVAGFYWAMMERTFWSNYVMGAVGVTVVVMAARMAQIWYGPAAAVQASHALQLGIGL
ncbi:hypothetical protein [Arthrobacter antibioticus]|uniref:hypothetical protein n=1 Tax=Arthrobacter sp. H35-MC1 TaxID=3046203 RepID=UPI0024BAC326|nr:hypothetical protein [Arthrobacter sp. H35-MC1]MDJ0317745.1 hypothetical protein [Arthrobacter sp. H35-MC1]